MRRILFVVNNLDVGGPQKGLLALLEALDPARFDCAVVTLQPGGALRRHVERLARVEDVDPMTHAVQVNRGRVISGLLALITRGWIRASAYYVVAVVMRVLGRPMNPWRQRVWAAAGHRLPKMADTFDAAFAVSSGLATYFVVDCVAALRKYHWVIGDYSRTAIDQPTDLEYFKQTTGGLAVSAECAEIFRGLFPELEQDVVPFQQLIPWKFYETEAAEAPEYAGYEDRLKVLTVSRLDPDKGLELAVDACALLVARGSRPRWVVLGDGPYRTVLEQKIRELNLEDDFVLAGFRNNVMDYVGAADVFVLPSRSEGRSSAVDEAIASGLPVVVTNYRTASSQVADGETGLICDMDRASLADAVSRFDDVAFRDRLSRQGRRDRALEARAANDLVEELSRA